MKILYLTLKAKYWDMIASGEKLEEYRSIKPFWIKRLCDIDYPEEEKGQSVVIPQDIIFDLEKGHDWEEVFKSYWTKFKPFTHVCFARGGHFHKSIPQMTVELKDIKIGEGQTKWGAVEGEKYFVIQLGKILEK